MNKKYRIGASPGVTLTFEFKRNIDPNLFYQVVYKNLYLNYGCTDFLQIFDNHPSLISYSCENLYFSVILTHKMFLFSPVYHELRLITQLF